MAIFFGTDGANNIPGSLEADTMFGAAGNDILNGSRGNDHIYGDSGNDSLIGGGGLDFVYGGEGNDTLNATEEGNDNLFGGIGNDVYQVSRTTDSITEGPNQGIDTVQSSVTYILNQANVENLVLTGATNINGTGNSLDNQIIGNSGNNVLNGLGGNDILNGKGGSDILTGGLGSDRFDFDTALPGAGVDTINDFVVGTDKIFLSKAVFSTLETVPLAGNVLLASDFASINVAAALEVAVAGNNPNEIVYNRQTGSLFYNANDAAAGFGTGGGKFATLVGSPDSLSNTDFTVTV
jgi:Ca2+-binding RTX toxin-like protein